MSASGPVGPEAAAERLTGVEEKLAYLEHAVGELDGMVYRQQQTIEGLERRCRELEQRIERLVEKLDEGAEGETSELPPHY